MGKVVFSFIVINRNNEKYIERCVSSISKIPVNEKEIIVVDDCSTDKSIETLKTHPDKIIKLYENHGIAKTREAGLKIAKGKYTVFIDSDIELISFDPNNIIDIFKINKEVVGIVGRYDSPISKSYNWNYILDARRRGIQFKNEIGYKFGIKKYTTFSGGFCIYKKNRLINLSHDGTIGIASEDLLQQIELLQKGHRFYYSPSFRGLHYHYRSFQELVSKAKSEARGEIWLLEKSYEKNLSVPKFDPIFTFPGLFILSVIFLNPYIILLNYLSNIFFIILHPNVNSLLLLPYQMYKDIYKIFIYFKETLFSRWSFAKFVFVVFICTLSSIVGKINWCLRTASRDRLSI